jgi:hypothetical protein
MVPESFTRYSLDNRSGHSPTGERTESRQGAAPTARYTVKLENIMPSDETGLRKEHKRLLTERAALRNQITGLELALVDKKLNEAFVALLRAMNRLNKICKSL